MPLRRSSLIVRVTIQGTTLKVADSYKYLGIQLDRQLKLNLHVKDLQARIFKRLNMARHISPRKCGASSQVLRTFYTAAIRSIIEYGAPIMITASQTVLKVEILQNKAMHTIARAPIWTNKSTLHAKLSLPPLQVRRKQMLLTVTDKFLRQTHHPVNLRLRHLLEYPLHDQSHTSWAYLTLCTWRAAGLSFPEPETTYRPAPWQTVQADFILDFPEGKKEDHPPTALMAMAMVAIEGLLGDDPETTLSAYTDGSVDPVTDRAGSGLVCYLGHTKVRSASRWFLDAPSRTLRHSHCARDSSDVRRQVPAPGH
jgi:hypothetical protein